MMTSGEEGKEAMVMDMIMIKVRVIPCNSGLFHVMESEAPCDCGRLLHGTTRYAPGSISQLASPPHAGKYSFLIHACFPAHITVTVTAPPSQRYLRREIVKGI
jgi:hypothetical protein